MTDYLHNRSLYPSTEDYQSEHIKVLESQLLDAIRLLGRYREGHRQSSGQECYVNIEQGDYRCVDCIEADRLTGTERMRRKMADERMNKLCASLASPNNSDAALENAIAAILA